MWGMGRMQIKFLLDALNLRCLLGVRVREAMEGRQLWKGTSQGGKAEETTRQQRHQPGLGKKAEDWVWGKQRAQGRDPWGHFHS